MIFVLKKNKILLLCLILFFGILLYILTGILNVWINNHTHVASLWLPTSASKLNISNKIIILDAGHRIP
jgi:hypothetical protein